MIRTWVASPVSASQEKKSCTPSIVHSAAETDDAHTVPAPLPPSLCLVSKFAAFHQRLRFDALRFCQDFFFQNPNKFMHRNFLLAHYTTVLYEGNRTNRSSESGFGERRINPSQPARTMLIPPFGKRERMKQCLRLTLCRWLSFKFSRSSLFFFHGSRVQYVCGCAFQTNFYRSWWWWRKRVAGRSGIFSRSILSFQSAVQANKDAATYKAAAAPNSNRSNRKALCRRAIG